MSKFRIAIAGFQHETNTFGATTASLEDFKRADSWPGLLTGNDVITGTLGINLPIAGFIEEASRHESIEVLPVLWCAAEPCAHVEDDAFEIICARIIDGIRDFGQIDGIYLDLHGAMVTESFNDGEGELLCRIRSAFGDEIPVMVSLDLHANISQEMVDAATAMEAYETYPHLDMAETGARCVALLLNQISGYRPAKALRQIPYLIPLHAQYTGRGPCGAFYKVLEMYCRNPGESGLVALGFTASDTRDAGPSVVAYAPDSRRADAIADDLMNQILAAETEFETALLDPEEAVKLAIANRDDKPVLIADVQDNPGAGATSDTMGVLKALINAEAQKAVVGLVHDPDMALRAHDVGVGSVFEGALAGKSGIPDDSPFVGRFKVSALSDGQCRYTGEMYGGGVAQLGKCAVLEVLDTGSDVSVVISSNRSQCLDQAIFTHIGIDLADYRIIVVKSTVHYRADFEPIVSAIIETAAPGLFACKLNEIPYGNLRSGIRLGPGGKAFVRPDSK